MAEHQIETRILLRYDTISNWLGSSLILKKGEAAIAAYPTRNTLNNTGATPENTPPAIGIKIGDGVHYFDELPWVQAVAADIYPWAKQVTKPIYDASEITNLANYIQQYSGSSSGISASAYRIVYNSSTQKYILQYQDAETEEWINATGEIDFSTVNQRINYLENWANGQTSSASIGSLEPLVLTIRDEFFTQLGKINYNDSAQIGQFVTSVSQTNGKISVTKTGIKASDIASGILPVEFGGTGISEISNNEVLVGNNRGTFSTKPIVTRFIEGETTDLATIGAITDYVTTATAGLTGAMHFIGEATVTITNNSAVDPQIDGYNFRLAEPGDVILGVNKEEYVWTGSNWRLLGDEGSYVVKGSITNADIADNADISISKIYNLSNLLDTKVDKIEGKSLTSNDFTDEYKQKLDNIEDNAQRNLIEHIYINGTEATPSVIDGKPNSLAIRLSSLTPEEEEKLRGIESGAQVNVIEHFFLNENEIIPKTYKELPKSIQLELIEYTEQEKQKLADIQAGAQVNTIQGISVNGVTVSPTQERVVDIIIPDHAEHANKIEKIYLNGVEQVPDSDKYIHIQIDESAVSFTVLKGARVPTGIPATPYEDIDLDATTKKLEFAKIAKTGWVYDIVNTPVSNTTDYLILRCGSATTLID